MKSKNTWLLVFFAGALFAFIYFYESRLRPPPPVSLAVLPNLQIDQISDIQIQPRDQFEIRLEKTNGVWQMLKPVSYPVQMPAVRQFLKSLSNLTAHARLGPKDTEGRSIGLEYGFDSPRDTILLQQGDQPVQIKIGATTAQGDELYLQVVGTTGIYVVGSEFTNDLPANANAWRDSSFVRLQTQPFDHLTVLNNLNNGRSMLLVRDTNTSVWSMVNPTPSPAFSSLVNYSLDRLQNAQISQFLPEDARNLADYGLQPPLIELRLADGTNDIRSIQFGGSPPNDTNSVYARAGSQAPVVILPLHDISIWRENFNVFRDPFLASMTAEQVTNIGSIECSGPDGRVNFTVYRTNGMIVDADQQSYPADEQLFSLAFQQLIHLRVAHPYLTNDQFAVKDIVPDSALPDYGLAPNPVRRYTISAISTNGAAPIISQIDFGGPNPNAPDTIYARRGHLSYDRAVYAVSNSDFLNLPSRAIDLRRRAIWRFDATNVIRLTVSTNGTSREWEHMSPYKWSIARGISDQAAETQIELLIRELGELDADYWVQRGDKDIAQYGFSDKSLRVTLQFRQNPSLAVSLVFGSSLPDGRRFAMTQMEDNQNWVFLYDAKGSAHLVQWLPQP